MAGVPDPPFLSVEGPEFANRVREADQLTRRVQDANWDFEFAPQVFAVDSNCDVAAKEVINVYDGQVQTRLGRLVMKGSGTRFNLLSHESPLSVYIGARREAFDDLNRQVGSAGLEDFAEFRELGPPQEVELYNPTLFYQMRDVVFWSVLNGFGLFPTGFEDVGKQLTSGNVIRNLLFTPSVAARGDSEPIYMQAYSGLRFPTEALEWMPKPLYGGMSAETLHVDTLLTTEPSSLSHPFLPLVAEGRVRMGDRDYWMRRFAGTSPKDATRGPGIPPEGVSR
jgi:hypothetical protein